MNPLGRVKIQAWILILVVFLLGGVTGASMDRLWFLKGQTSPQAGRPGRGPGRMVDRLKSDLNLTDQQTASVRTIFEDMRKEFPPSRFNECPGVKESREKQRARIRVLLTPEQQKKYDEDNARRDAEMMKEQK